MTDAVTRWAVDVVGWILVGLLASVTTQLILPGRNPAGIGVALLLGASGSLLARFVVGLLRGADATQFGVESIIWAVTGAFAAAAGEKVLLESRATHHHAFV